MGNDIMTRLRDWSIKLYPAEYGALMERAADEIDDQRKRVDYWYERCMNAEECVRFLQRKKWWQL